MERNKLSEGKVQPPAFLILSVKTEGCVCDVMCRGPRGGMERARERVRESLIPASIRSHNNGGEIPLFFCRFNRRPVSAVRLHNQIQTLFSTISLPSSLHHPPSLPLSLVFFFPLKRAESIRKATSLFCHLRVCCTSISFPSSRTRFRGGQFPLLSISLPFIYLFRYFYLFIYVLPFFFVTKPPTQKKHPLTNHSGIYSSARCPGKIFLFFLQFRIFVSSSQSLGKENILFLFFWSPSLHFLFFFLVNFSSWRLPSGRPCCLAKLLSIKGPWVAMVELDNQ